MVTEPITLRQATVDDVPFLRAMIWEAVLASPSFIEAHQGLEAIQQAEEQRWQAWQPESDPAFVAIDARAQKLGAITLRPHPTGAGKGWQLGLGVKAEVRGQGIGYRLVEQAISYVREVAAPYLTLFVDVANTPAIALYRRTGFVEIGERHNVIEMRLRFADT